MCRYVLKGINDEYTTCEVCGKTELRRVMWLAELDADGIEGEAFAAGTTCGAKLLAGKGISRKTVNDAVKNFNALRIRAVREAERQHARYAELVERTDAMLARMAKERVSFAERVHDPEWVEVEALRKEINGWAEANARIVLE